jgi:hypothetical protein
MNLIKLPFLAVANLLHLKVVAALIIVKVAGLTKLTKMLNVEC